MTKERKLAIEMWKDIRSKIIALDHSIGHADIIKYRQEFCERHDLKWMHDCWFCQYIKKRYSHGCMKCPLSDCRAHSDYSIVTSSFLNNDVRVAACNAIIKALGGKV